MEDVLTNNKQKQLLEKLEKRRPSEGIPQVFDSVFKTITIRIPRFLIPLINEMFGTEYALGDEVEMVYGEETSVFNTIRILQRRTDSKFALSSKRYHLECQTDMKEEVAIRMFEYDWMEAVNHIQKEKNEYVIRLQNSGVLYLRKDKNTPEAYIYRLILPDEKECIYKIPIVRNLDYSLEEIFRKKLYILLPYYLLHYESRMKKLPVNNVADSLEADMKMLYNELKQQEKNEVISDYERKLLEQLIIDIGSHVFRNEESLKERVERNMGGQVLEYEWETEYRNQINEAKDEGRLEGRLENLISLVCRKLQKNKTPEVIADELEEEITDIERICEAAKGYAPEYDVEKIYQALQIETI